MQGPEDLRTQEDQAFQIPTSEKCSFEQGRGKFFYLELELFCLQLSFFAYSPFGRLLKALSHCK